MKYQRIAVKIGSNVLTRPDGTLNITRMSALVDQVAALHKAGVEIVLISSGAVASGRSELHIARKLNSIHQRQLYSAVGQAKLINRYYDLFREHGIVVGQVLTTKENFATRRHYLNQRDCMRVMLESKVIPIVNENDTVSVTELMFTDNDELSGMIAGMMDMQALILLSNVDGIYSAPPSDPACQVIRLIEPGQSPAAHVLPTRSSFGRGGMLTKISIAAKIADEGIEVLIANGTREHILTDLLDEHKDTLCTRFAAGVDAVSSVKKWIAHSGGFAKGAIHISDPARDALRAEAAVSLLPVGITRIEGRFDKDDIVSIKDSQGHTIGCGRVQYDSHTAETYMGHHGHKALIHYNYLYME